jgi:hypothetical protein
MPLTLTLDRNNPKYSARNNTRYPPYLGEYLSVPLQTKFPDDLAEFFFSAVQQGRTPKGGRPPRSEPLFNPTFSGGGAHPPRFPLSQNYATSVRFQ